jgi:hypothetical protein
MTDVIRSPQPDQTPKGCKYGSIIAMVVVDMLTTTRCRIDEMLLHYSWGFRVDSAALQRRLGHRANFGCQSVESPDGDSLWPNNQLNGAKYGAQH